MTVMVGESFFRSQQRNVFKNTGLSKLFLRYCNTKNKVVALLRPCSNILVFAVSNVIDAARNF